MACLLMPSAYGQDYVANGSFEGPPAKAVPAPWEPIATPDRQPSSLPDTAYHGLSYVFFVASSANYIEGLRLDMTTNTQRMDSGFVYKGSVALFSDTVYNPGMGQLYILGSQYPPTTADTLWRSPPIPRMGWGRYTFSFNAYENYDQLTIINHHFNPSGLSSGLAVDSLSIVKDSLIVGLAAGQGTRKEKLGEWDAIRGTPWMPHQRGIKVTRYSDGTFKKELKF